MSRPQPVVVHERESELEGWPDSPGDVRWRTLLSGDRTPSNALTLGVAEVPVGASQVPRLHSHATPEVYYVLEGEGVVTVSGRDYPLEAGTAVFLPGNAEHRARNTGSELLRILYVFAADSFSDVEYEFKE